MTCRTHTAIIACLDDLRKREVISDTVRAKAAQAVRNECEYVIQEHDVDGNCVLRHP